MKTIIALMMLACVNYFMDVLTSVTEPVAVSADQQGDWFTLDGEKCHLLSNAHRAAIMTKVQAEPHLWLPSEGDVLAMLDEHEGTLQMTIWPERSIAHKQTTNLGRGATPLIALLELLRAVEGKG